MSAVRRLSALLNSLVLLLAAACSPAAASTLLPGATATLTASPPFVLVTPTNTATAAAPSASETAVPATNTPPPTTESTLTTPTLAPPSPTACPPEGCVYAAQYFLQRPIMPPDNDRVDITYRFGGTQGGMREPHHGIEMLNPFGTPVLAAADGLVIIAGQDIDPTSPHGEWPITFYGPYSNFYGSLVVIEHQAPPALLEAFPDMPQPVYTLYAHLSVITVEQGQVVQAGDPIGQVGMAGIATGNHLHFEVRLGENTYASVSNPELWLIPHEDEAGAPMGGLAARIIDPWGQNFQVEGGIVLQRLPEGPDGPKDLEFYTMAYQEKALIGVAPWYESFAIGDLPAGLYRISFAYGGVKKFLVEIYPGRLTAAEFRLGE